MVGAEAISSWVGRSGDYMERHGQNNAVLRALGANARVVAEDHPIRQLLKMCCRDDVAKRVLSQRDTQKLQEAATKLIYLAIRNFEKGGRNVREWFAARNQFAIMFEERFNA